jgi:tetrachlorobenzoquinone reductase
MTSEGMAIVPAEPLGFLVKSITYEAREINTYELRPMDGDELPLFSAGAHIDVRLPSGQTRSYSLVNAPGECHRYVIAVSHVAHSRGGSRYLHERLRVGEALFVSRPRNNFTLVEDAAHTLLIAGGIGITPLWSMVQRLETLQRSWELYYCARTKQHAAFLDALKETSGARQGRLHLTFDQEPGSESLNIEAVVAAAPRAAHLYCCGPSGMLRAFETACSEWPARQMHVEYFAPKERASTDGDFRVVLARSDQKFDIPRGETILSVLLAAGVAVPNSCREGVCGSCETRVLDGVPDHRDSVLSIEEKVSGCTMMICCSGCKSEKLVLDL